MVLSSFAFLSCFLDNLFALLALLAMESLAS